MKKLSPLKIAVAIAILTTPLTNLGSYAVCGEIPPLAAQNDASAEGQPEKPMKEASPEVRPEINASWIGDSVSRPLKATHTYDQQRRNSWYCFRHQVDLESVPQSLVARIACDSKYWLWINGKMVVREGGLKRGSTPTGTWFDEIELSSHFREGSNQVAVLLWHFGRHGFSHHDSGYPGLLFDAVDDQYGLDSGSDWYVNRHPSWATASGTDVNFRLPESNVRFDARLDTEGWETSEIYRQWSHASVVAAAGEPPFGELHQRSIPMWKDFGISEYEQLHVTQRDEVTDFPRPTKAVPGKNIASVHELSGMPQEDLVLIGSLPANLQIHPTMAISAPAGLVIDIETDRIQQGSDHYLRGQYVTKDGRQEFELPIWLNGHEVRYFIPAGVEVLEVGYRQTGYDAKFVGRFSCDNEPLNRLWLKSQRTLYVTMRDTYMDCPDRERAQWWGDVVNELGEAFYVFDAGNGPLLARKAIRELAAWQREDGVLYSPVPAGIAEETGDPRADRETRVRTWQKELPRQMLASVGKYGFWTYYWYSEDISTIRTVYPAVRRYLMLWTLDDRGLAVHRKGDWDWTDWGREKDMAVLENAWLSLAFEGAKNMASLIGEQSDADMWLKKQQRIEQAFDSTFWQGEHYRSAAHQGEVDDRANAMAVIAGLAPPERWPAIVGVLQTQRHASPYMEKYVLESLFMMGRPDAAIERMSQRYHGMIESHASTLWETFAKAGSGRAGGGTYNHAWSGGPLTLMQQYVAGIAPVKPAFRAFRVAPQPGSLDLVESTVPTKYGSIELLLTRMQGDVFSVELTVPAGTTAYMVIDSEDKMLAEGQHRFEVSLKGNRPDED